ncbi:unnamed protein product [Cylindrotheca closterium]|uniref:Uncharacterized protein n=1 Tax=Cylindrotheca closterium TaxID=2856 RepID=A0AAD2FIW3_9STRA|nr:unnamed protein product [Cylindrotheca closterium]
MFRRKNSGSLPMNSSPRTGGGSFMSRPGDDGSGKSIRMDAPIIKSWKQASSFTKYSYYILAFFIFLMFVGYRYLRYWNASIWLTCHQHECTLDMTPAGGRSISVVFSRTQLDFAQAVKTDKAGNFLSIDTSKYEPPNRDDKGRKKYKSGSYKGPDELGEYKSYALSFKKETPEGVEKPPEVPDSDFSDVLQYMRELDGGVLQLTMRQFGLAQSRTRVRSSINKVDSYVKKRRQKLIIKESATLPWQGILCLIFGLLGFMLTLLVGQFWDEKPHKYGGPGSRRSVTKPTTKSNFVVDTGRPSKYPPGYQSKRFQ